MPVVIRAIRRASFSDKSIYRYGFPRYLSSASMKTIHATLSPLILSCALLLGAVPLKADILYQQIDNPGSSTIASTNYFNVNSSTTVIGDNSDEAVGYYFGSDGDIHYFYVERGINPVYQSPCSPIPAATDPNS